MASTLYTFTASVTHTSHVPAAVPVLIISALSAPSSGFQCPRDALLRPHADSTQATVPSSQSSNPVLHVLQVVIDLVINIIVVDVLSVHGRTSRAVPGLGHDGRDLLLCLLARVHRGWKKDFLLNAEERHEIGTPNSKNSLLDNMHSR